MIDASLCVEITVIYSSPPGMMLLLMEEEESFWLFLTIVDTLLPHDYYTKVNCYPVRLWS
jgi:hypothetical protein